LKEEEKKEEDMPSAMTGGGERRRREEEEKRKKKKKKKKKEKKKKKRKKDEFRFSSPPTPNFEVESFSFLIFLFHDSNQLIFQLLYSSDYFFVIFQRKKIKERKKKEFL